MFFNRLGEIRDRSFEQQRYRASGLNLVTAAIVLWNAVYLERAVDALRASGREVDERLLQHLPPLGWEHINLTGDDVWRQSRKLDAGRFRPLRILRAPLVQPECPAAQEAPSGIFLSLRKSRAASFCNNETCFPGN